MSMNSISMASSDAAAASGRTKRLGRGDELAAGVQQDRLVPGRARVVQAANEDEILRVVIRPRPGAAAEHGDGGAVRHGDLLSS